MSHRGARNYNPRGHQGSRGRGSGRGRGFSGPPKPPVACSNFTFDGNCQYGQSCKFQHRVRCVGTFNRAHQDTIYCIAAGPLPGGSFQIFTGGKDQTVKRWSVTPSSGNSASKPAPSQMIPEGLLPSDALAGPPPSRSQNDGLVFYDVKLENTTPFESAVTSVLLAADCLFCGLANGKVRGFVSATGHSFDLVAHQKEVHAMVLIDQILVTGDFGGGLCFWQPGRDPEGRPTFNCASTLHLANGIKTVKEILVPTPEGPVKTLWVGCVERVYIILLQTLAVASDIRLPQPPGMSTKAEVCMELLPFGNSVLAGGVSGTIYQLSSTGQGIERQEHCDEIVCMEGVMSESGPMLLIGSRDGWLHWLSLPSCQGEAGEVVGDGFLTESVSLQAHGKNVRGVRVVDPAAYPGMPAAPPFIVSVSEDQNLHLWSLSTSSRPPPRQQHHRGRGGRRY